MMTEPSVDVSTTVSARSITTALLTCAGVLADANLASPTA